MKKIISFLLTYSICLNPLAANLTQVKSECSSSKVGLCKIVENNKITYCLPNPDGKSCPSPSKCKRIYGRNSRFRGNVVNKSKVDRLMGYLSSIHTGEKIAKDIGTEEEIRRIIGDKNLEALMAIKNKDKQKEIAKKHKLLIDNFKNLNSSNPSVRNKAAKAIDSELISLKKVLPKESSLTQGLSEIISLEEAERRRQLTAIDPTVGHTYWMVVATVLVYVAVKTAKGEPVPSDLPIYRDFDRNPGRFDSGGAGR